MPYQMHRVIRMPLLLAVQGSRPKGMPIGRPRGKRGEGMRYERKLAEALPEAEHGQWFQFVDAGGPGNCQVDLILRLPKAVVVLEAKYTWTPVGHTQIALLYKPVVEKAWNLPVYGIVVCKKLTVATKRAANVYSTLDEAVSSVLSGDSRAVLHWLGAGPIGWGGLGTRKVHPLSAHLDKKMLHVRA